MSNIYENLSWLPTPPSEFSQKVSAAHSASELRDLSKFSLDDNQLRKLAKKMQGLQGSHSPLAPLMPVSIGVISNATTKLAVPALVGTALRFGIALTVLEADYNQIAQEAFSNESTFTGKRLSAVLVAMDHRGLPLLPTPGDRVAAENNVQTCLNYIKSVIESLRT